MILTKNTNPIEKGKIINLNRFPKSLSITEVEKHKVLLPAYLFRVYTLGGKYGEAEGKSWGEKFILY